jgi:hypothetical protein
MEDILLKVFVVLLLAYPLTGCGDGRKNSELKKCLEEGRTAYPDAKDLFDRRIATFAKQCIERKGLPVEWKDLWCETSDSGKTEIGPCKPGE